MYFCYQNTELEHIDNGVGVAVDPIIALCVYI